LFGVSYSKNGQFCCGKSTDTSVTACLSGEITKSLSALAWFYTGIASRPAWIVGLLSACAACLFVSVGIWRLQRSILTQNLHESLILVKRVAKLVPIWVTVVAWSMLWSSYLVFHWR